eukprot:scaffold24886_cov206-Cylindrotheca_fusiformis.AAC.1
MWPRRRRHPHHQLPPPGPSGPTYCAPHADHSNVQQTPCGPKPTTDREVFPRGSQHGRRFLPRQPTESPLPTLPTTAPTWSLIALLWIFPPGLGHSTKRLPYWTRPAPQQEPSQHPHQQMGPSVPHVRAGTLDRPQQLPT